MLENYRVAAQLVASRVVLSSTELVRTECCLAGSRYHYWRINVWMIILFNIEAITLKLQAADSFRIRRPFEKFQITTAFVPSNMAQLMRRFRREKVGSSHKISTKSLSGGRESKEKVYITYITYITYYIYYSYFRSCCVQIWPLSFAPRLTHLSVSLCKDPNTPPHIINHNVITLME
jgi:hypothetical protein